LQQVADRPHCPFQDVLAVVDHHQEVPVGQIAGDDLFDGAAVAGSQAPHRAHGRHDHRRIGHRCQLDQPGSVGATVDLAAGRLDGETSLAGAPTPVSTTSRWRSTSSPSSANSTSRPTNELRYSGRLWLGPIVRTGAVTAGSEGWRSSYRCSGSARSFNRWTPRSSRNAGSIAKSAWAVTADRR